jgi:NAD(P)-dependent dehydrogenase (short-subunit alcohol dehydrogenase family)
MALTGKTAVLFGAGAIATGYASLLAEQRMNIAIVSRGESCEKLAAAISGKGSNVLTMHADASNPGDVTRVFREMSERFKSIDVLVNGSGGNERGAVFADLEGFLKADLEAAERVLRSNYFSKVCAIQQFVGHLHEVRRRDGAADGSIINITSMSGFVPLTRVAFYSDAFAAVESFTKSVAFLLGHYGLGRANNVAVGFLIGEQNRRLLISEDGTPTARGMEILTATAQHRYVTPQEIGKAVLYLADSDISSGVNGHTLRVDGGFGIVNLSGSGYPAAPHDAPSAGR